STKGSVGLGEMPKMRQCLALVVSVCGFLTQPPQRPRVQCGTRCRYAALLPQPRQRVRTCTNLRHSERALLFLCRIQPLGLFQKREGCLAIAGLCVGVGVEHQCLVALSFGRLLYQLVEAPQRVDSGREIPEGNLRVSELQEHP